MRYEIGLGLFNSACYVLIYLLQDKKLLARCLRHEDRRQNQGTIAGRKKNA